MCRVKSDIKGFLFFFFFFFPRVNIRSEKCSFAFSRERSLSLHVSLSSSFVRLPPSIQTATFPNPTSLNSFSVISSDPLEDNACCRFSSSCLGAELSAVCEEGLLPSDEDNFLSGFYEKDFCVFSENTARLILMRVQVLEALLGR